MNLKKLGDIINETTQEFRVGPTVTHRRGKEISVTEVYAMPHESEAGPELEMHDTHFIKVGVNKGRAQELRRELVSVLEEYPQADRLAQGPSYIEVGGVLGSQDHALRLFALGESLGLWEVITPQKMGITGADANDLAGRGFVMISGFQK